MKNQLRLALKGAAMGMAEVIPGVSGGTIAFITGIYEKLINTIKAFGPGLLSTLKKEGVKGLWKEINGSWLIVLLTGMVIGLGIGVAAITHILEVYPAPLWSFFFGLILASAIYIAKQVKKWKMGEIISLMIGVIVAYGITVLTPAEGSTELWFVFLSGSIAISALILPGVSGSFILLLMGMYFTVIGSVKNLFSTFSSESFTIVVVFALGCIVGLTTFSRVLSWTFKKFKYQTLAVLTGFMLGSLNKIWPWRKPSLGLDEKTGNIISIETGMNLEEIKVLKELKLSPQLYESEVGPSYLLICIILCIIGFASVFVMEKLDKTTSTN